MTGAAAHAPEPPFRLPCSQICSTLIVVWMHRRCCTHADLQTCRSQLSCIMHFGTTTSFCYYRELSATSGVCVSPPQPSVPGFLKSESGCSRGSPRTYQLTPEDQPEGWNVLAEGWGFRNRIGRTSGGIQSGVLQCLWGRVAGAGAVLPRGAPRPCARHPLPAEQRMAAHILGAVPQGGGPPRASPGPGLQAPPPGPLPPPPLHLLPARLIHLLPPVLLQTCLFHLQ